MPLVHNTLILKEWQEVTEEEIKRRDNIIVVMNNGEIVIKKIKYPERFLDTNSDVLSADIGR